MMHMHVRSRFFAREEVEAKPAHAKNGRVTSSGYTEKRPAGHEVDIFHAAAAAAEPASALKM
jgi:hypothetical protein